RGWLGFVARGIRRQLLPVGTVRVDDVEVVAACLVGAVHDLVVRRPRRPVTDAAAGGDLLESPTLGVRGNQEVGALDILDGNELAAVAGHLEAPVAVVVAGNPLDLAVRVRDAVEAVASTTSNLVDDERASVR